MKKILTIILLTALILASFTACDGEVDYKLWNTDSSTTIKLSIASSIYGEKFCFKDDNGSSCKSVEFTPGVEKWSELIEKPIGHTLVFFGDEITDASFKEDDGKMMLGYYFIVTEDKVQTGETDVSSDDSISLGTTYYLVKPSA
ncbi:MAG: hypothetical protein K5634_00565 [Sphaerochaetaceae bacterium]|nr:hypothetical protein [Sphaerochaetaceae bacterium]